MRRPGSDSPRRTTIPRRRLPAPGLQRPRRELMAACMYPCCTPLRARCRMTPGNDGAWISALPGGRTRAGQLLRPTWSLPPRRRRTAAEQLLQAAALPPVHLGWVVRHAKSQEACLELFGGRAFAAGPDPLSDTFRRVGPRHRPPLPWHSFRHAVGPPIPDSRLLDADAANPPPNGHPDS